MEFIQNDDRDTIQCGVSLNHAGENGVGHYVDFGGGGNAGIIPQSIASLHTHRLTQKLGMTGGHRHRRKTTWLRHQNLSGKGFHQSQGNGC